MLRVRVWDWPTRVFHWSLMLSVIGLIITGNVGGSWMAWHLRLGVAVLALLIFRVLWGLVGGYWSRFVQFIYAPASVLAYLRGQSPLSHRVGHTPLGALSVFALLVLLLVQVFSGLLTDDAIFYAGAWARWAPYDTIELASRYHQEVGKLLVIALVVLHVGALGVYAFKFRNNLVKAMLTGDKTVPSPVHSSSDGPLDWLKALVVLGVACGLTALIVQWQP